MRSISIALLSLLICTGAAAQKVSITVAVTVNKTDSFPPATLQLYSLPDTLLIGKQLAKQEGNSFTVNRFSKYLIKVSSTGFTATEKTVAITDKAVSVQVPLKRMVTGMEEVVLVSRKPLVKQEDDKTIVDAEVLANSSTNAYEVLEKTPGAIVDQDGNVYLSSATPATIQINGREVKLSAADLASLLKSLPAGSVSKDRNNKKPFG